MGTTQSAQAGLSQLTTGFEVATSHLGGDFCYLSYDDLETKLEEQDLEGIAFRIDEGMKVEKVSNLSEMLDDDPSMEVSARLPKRFKVPHCADFSLGNGAVSLRLVCKEDETANTTTRLNSIVDVDDLLQKFFSIGLQEVDFIILLELLVMQQEPPVTGKSQQHDRWAARIVWGVSITGTVKCHEDPYEKYREMLREGKSKRAVARKMAKFFKIRGEELDQKAIQDFIDDFEKHDAERLRKRKSGAKVEDSEERKVDWKFIPGHVHKPTWDEEVVIIPGSDGDPYQRISQQGLEESMPTVADFLYELATHPDKWRPFISYPLIQPHSARDHYESARSMERAGKRADMYEHIQRSFLQLGIKQEVLPNRGRMWMFGQYKARIDELLDQKRGNAITQEVFDDAITKTCGRVLHLLSNCLIPEAQTAKDWKSVALYVRMQGDYLRYLCKFTSKAIGERAVVKANSSGGKTSTNRDAAEWSYKTGMQTIDNHINYEKDLDYFLLHGTNAVNYVLFCVEILRDYTKAKMLSKEFIEQLERCERAQYDLCRDQMKEFSMPVSAQMAMQLLKRNSRVLNSEMLVLKVTFDSTVFRKIQKKLAEAFPEELVDAMEYKKRNDKPKAPRRLSKEEIEALAGKTEKKQVFGYCCARNDPPPPTLPSEDSRESHSEDKKIFPDEKVVELWLKQQSMQRPGIRWLTDAKRVHDDPAKAFHIVARVNVSQSAEMMEKLAALPLSKQEEIQLQHARELVLGSFKFGEGDGKLDVSKVQPKEQELTRRGSVEEEPSLLPPQIKWSMDTKEDLNTNIENVSNFARQASRKMSGAAFMRAATKKLSIPGVHLARAMTEEVLGLEPEIEAESRNRSKDAAAAFKRQRSRIPTIRGATVHELELEEVDELDQDNEKENENANAVRATSKKSASAPREDEVAVGEESTINLKLKMMPEVLAGGPYFEVQEHFAGLDQPFMVLRGARTTPKSPDYTWLVQVFHKFTLARVQKDTIDGKKTLHAHCLSARRNPLQACERGAK
eukprot:gnl/MRDRNA2_/MRDRNA2_94270_c0_seq1.p1 gnl/MRDRNA2_/MRDRNA2_94270_c0~~gnl/MRDRNA2_/MRDRNA2_94270_c0_seq1.p1  ORF type:complete len:1019 (+),score=241.77 gnl/MRDRNA2_/MRDRNA2_94270_c0_seq1:59-3115(+)